MPLRRKGKTIYGETDTAQMQVKVDLRLRFLRAYHQQGARVFDACQGDGHVWAQTRRHHEVESYWGVDLKSKRGRMTTDSEKILRQGVSDNVLDVDTYGSPWGHWLALLPNIRQPTTVFLTVGRVGIGEMPAVVKKFIGLDRLSMPPALYGKLWPYAQQFLLSAPSSYGLRIVECVRYQASQSVQYIGVHLARTKGKP